MDRAVIQEIHTLFTKAENFCKSVEVFFSEGVVIPAINELRYCGKHLLDAHLAEDSRETEEQLRRAKAHCERAIYDAAEVAALLSLKAFSDFQSRYRKILIGDVIGDEYNTICKDFHQLRTMTREPAADEDKEQKYTELMQVAQKGMDHLTMLESQEEELKKALMAQQKTETARRKNQWGLWIGLFLSGVAAAAAVGQLMKT